MRLWRSRNKKNAPYDAVKTHCKSSNESIFSLILLPLFFWGLREASSPAQYALAFTPKNNLSELDIYCILKYGH